MKAKSFEGEKIFISFLDDDGKIISGWFELLIDNLTYIKIRGASNNLIIPWHRILKIKEDREGGRV